MKIKKGRKDFSIMIVVLSLALLINIVLIFLRIEIVSYTGDEPNYFVPWDTIIFNYPAFYSDELFYYNVQTDNPFLYEVANTFSFMMQERVFVYINFYGYYVRFLKGIVNSSWVGLIFFTGLVYNVVFIILLSFILTNIFELQGQKSLFLLLLIIISPPYLQLISSWMRDLLIIDLMLIAFIAAKQRRVFLWVIATILQLLIRAYMVPIHVFLMLYFYPRRKRMNTKDLVKVEVLLGIIMGAILVVPLYQVGYQRLVEEFPQRFVQNFTGLTLWLMTGHVKLRTGLYNFLFNIESLSSYFYPAFYCVLYMILFVRIFVAKAGLTQEQRTYTFAFFIVGLYITIMHAAYLGFLVSRIQFITMIFGYIALASLFEKHQLT